MEVTKIILISAVVFPTLASIAIGVAVHFSVKRLREQRKREESHTRLIRDLEVIVNTQDKVLDTYREG